MDKIKVNGRFLIVPEGFFIPVNKRSPLFVEDGIPAEASYPFKIANDPEGVNAKILKFPHKINVLTQLPRVYDCEYYIGGTWKIKGKIDVINANSRWFEVNVYSPVYDFDESFKNKRLRDFFTETVELLPAPEIRIKFSTSGDGIGFFNFTLNNIIYPVAWNTDIENTLHDIRDIINADSENNLCTMEVDGTNFDIIQVAPGPKCIVDYDAVIEAESGTFVIELVSELDWLKDYNDDFHDAMMALVNATYADSDFCFPMIYNPGFYGYGEAGSPDKNPDYTGFINYFSTDGAYMLNFKTGEVFAGNYYTVSPQMFIGKFWDYVWETAGLTVTGDFFQHVDWNKIKFFGNRSLDCIFHAQYADVDYLTFYNSWLPGDLIPDITVTEFVNGIKSKFCLAPLYDPSKMCVHFVQRNSVATSNVFVDITKAPYKEEMLIRYSETYTGVKFTQKNDANDNVIALAEYAEQHADYIIGDGSTEISFLFATTSKGRISRPQWDAFYTQVYVPYVDMLGSSLEYGIGLNEWSARLLIYRGMSEDTNGQEYPYATNDDYFDNEPVTGALSLLPADLFINHWQYWAEYMINAVPADVTILLNLKQLKQIEFDKKLKFMESRMVVKEINIDGVTNDGFYYVRIDFVARSAGKGL